MFGGNKVSLDPDLHAKACQRANELGYGSVAEYVAHLLQKDLQSSADRETRDKVLEQMKGLGYLQ